MKRLNITILICMSEFSSEWLKVNRYYHKVLKLPLSMYFGVSPGWMHERLQIMFALINVHPDYYEVESITGMTTERFSLFVENIWQWVTENSIPLQEYQHIGEHTNIKIIKR